MTLRTRLVPALVIGTTLLALSACDGGESKSESETETTAGPGVVTITMTDDSCEYDGPVSVRDGLLTVELVKEMDGDGSFELLRVARGTTFDELEARVEDDGERLEEGLQPVGYGGLASLEVSAELFAADRQRVFTPQRQDLEPGAHAFLCIRSSGLDLAGPLELAP